MIFFTFLYFLAMVSLVLAFYAIIAYKWPDSMAGNVAAVLRG